MRAAFAVRFAVLVAITNAPLLGAWGAQATGYDQVVSKAQADLSAGRAAKALSESKAAIAIASKRWQAYVVAAGALEVEHHYDQAIDNYTKALERSPEGKKPAIRALLAKCLAQERGSTASVPDSAARGGRPVSQGPTFKETMDWLVSKNSQEGIGYRVVMSEHYSVPVPGQAPPQIVDYSYRAEIQPSADGAECTAEIKFQSPNVDYSKLGAVVIRFSALAPRSVRVKQVDVQREGGAGTSISSNGPNNALGPTTTTVITVTPNEPRYFSVTGLRPYINGSPMDFSLGDQKVGASNALIYADQDLAMRVAKALNHAIDICGGKGKPEAF